MNTPDQHIASDGRGLGWFARNYHWTICALLFFAAVINYVDRMGKTQY